MKILAFKSSTPLTLGVELEYQIVNPYTQNMAAKAKALIRNIKNRNYSQLIKPEVTQSMIEINSSVKRSSKELLQELRGVRSFLMEQAKVLGICICGGGTHPYQKWTSRKIFPSRRFITLSKQFQYLSKRATVFGQHIHIGVASGDDAIYLTHALTRYVPQFIALSASSPFLEGVDSGFDSSRSHFFSAFPLSGVMPYLVNWHEFSAYFNKMRALKIVKTMKDFYWDLRPKPEFGTVEIRVCDVPLTIDKAVQLAAYVQTLSAYLLQERPLHLSPDLYYLYGYNRFQAARYGLKGMIIDPQTLVSDSIENDIAATLEKLEKYAHRLKTTAFLHEIREAAIKNQNDAVLLRKLFSEVGDLHDVVKELCVIWGLNHVKS